MVEKLAWYLVWGLLSTIVGVTAILAKFTFKCPRYVEHGECGGRRRRNPENRAENQVAGNLKKCFIHGLQGWVSHRRGVSVYKIFAQRKLIEKYLEGGPSLRDLPYTEFVDDGFTGTNFECPAFQEMVEKIKTGKISCAIAKDLFRFGRNYLEVGDYLEHLFSFLGIRFIAVNDNYGSQDYAGVNAGIDIAFKNILHDYYSRDLSIKVRSAQRSRMKTGKYVNVPPYGYQRDPEDKHHHLPDPDTAPVVRRIFQMIIDGSSTAQVAAALNQEGIPTPLLAKGIRRKDCIINEGGA